MQTTCEITENKENQQRVERELVLQCAPLLAGLKVSNLVHIPNELAPSAEEILRQTDLCCAYFFHTDTRTTFLIYEKDRLLQQLLLPRNQVLLSQSGYEFGCDRSFSCLGGMEYFLNQALLLLKSRYLAYISGETKTFPHEMGVYLGYPIEDVVGFMVNHGQNSLYTGYWKVYTDVAEKLALFRSYDQARDHMLELLSMGYTVADLNRYYRRAIN